MPVDEPEPLVPKEKDEGCFILDPTVIESGGSNKRRASSSRVRVLYEQASLLLCHPMSLILES